MFQWQITLSDKQVLMLAAFHTGFDDENGSRFSSVHAMIGDAWDVRAVRKLCEAGLLTVKDSTLPNGMRSNIWNITTKGELIALAIMEDADNLKQLSERAGLKTARLVNSDAHRRWVESKTKKKAAAKL